MPNWLNPITWFRWWRYFTTRWFATVPRAAIGSAIPSLIAGFVLAGLALLASVQDSDWRKQRIRASLQTAASRGNHDEVELLCRRLLRHDPDDRALQLQLAEARTHGENGDAALASIRQLALRDRYPLAARWLLNDQFSPVTWDAWDADKRTEFGALLKVAVSNEREDKRLVSLYAEYLLTEGQGETALPYLEKLINDQPLRALQAAAIYRQTGNERRAANAVQVGLQQLQQLTREEPANVDLYLSQSRFLLFQKEFEQTVRLLRRGMEITQDARLKQAAAETLVLWSRALPDKEQGTALLAKQLTLLRQAVELAPENRLVIESLIPLVLDAAKTDDPTVNEIREILVNGVAPELAHFIRGTAAMFNDDLEQASFHLELAAEKLPQVPAVLNNLAVALAGAEAPDLEKALGLVDAALERKPARPYFHETRGQILLRMERYQEAIGALERALAAPALRSQAHAGLAEAYGALGQNEIAAEHRRMADDA